ncbi:uncharacterized protein [Pyrus communis]|uniref:uncharacterized protein n=1 Tax=Pyrus communis TaxID=23211 RepID=UPI0035BF0257
MESLGGAGFSPGGCIVRKKRSMVSHRPRLNPPTFSLSSSIPIGKGTIDEDQNNKKKIVLSNVLGSKSNPKKLKLKFGGVTHTINTNYITDVGDGGGSSTAKSSSSLDAFTPQLNPLAQVPHPDSCGDGVNEPVRKSKRAPKRRTSGAGFNEEDEEIQFLERLSASKLVQREFKWTFAFMEMIVESISPQGWEKLVKKGSLSLLLEGRKESTLTTRHRTLQPGKHIFPGSGFLDITSDLLPVPSKSKKEAMSEVERQLKKAEAAQRRKAKLENAANVFDIGRWKWNDN